MKIGFDISDLATNRADGTTRYTYELAKRLPQLGKSDEWIYFTPFDSPAISGLAQGKPRVTKVVSRWPKYWTQMRLPFDLYRYKPDVLFMPIQQIPFARPKKMKTVAVMHDLAVHLYPEQFMYKDWLLLHVFSAYVAREADEIIAVSAATAKDVERFYGRTENIHVVHHGVDHEQFRAPSEEEKISSWHNLQKKYSLLKKPYILFVGQIQPRKNIVRLVEAFETLAQKDSELQLVIAGGHGWLQTPIVKRIKESKFVNRIFTAGRVSDELLPALYWNAEVFVLPSLYEGFGMPVLEAMASGCPVVTSNVSSLPEITGDAAVLVDPLSSESIAEGIIQAWGHRENLIQKGLARAKQFSWDRCAEQLLRILNI